MLHFVNCRLRKDTLGVAVPRAMIARQPMFRLVWRAMNQGVQGVEVGRLIVATETMTGPGAQAIPRDRDDVRKGERPDSQPDFGTDHDVSTLLWHGFMQPRTAKPYCQNGTNSYCKS